MPTRLKQKETQIKYLVEQVAALRMYGGAIKKGYDVVNGGLQHIGRSKEGDLILHRDHLASLLLVKPGVKNSEVVGHIIFLQAAIMSVYSECKGRIRRDRDYSREEKAYFTGVLDNVGRECKAAGEEAFVLISDSQYQMHDDERIKRLLVLWGNLEEQYVFLKQFRNDISVAALSRLKDQKGVKKLKSFY